MAFHGLASAAAEQLTQRDFGSRINAANPAQTVARAGKLLRYVNDYRALVRAPKRRLKVITSSVPLRSASGDGVMRPVNLDMRSRGGGFAAVNPLQRVSVSRQLGGGVRIGSSGLRIFPLGTNVAGTIAPGGQSVFFPRVAADEDVAVAPTVDGAELSTVLRSRLSSQQIAYRVALPHGEKLAQRGASAVVTRAGHAVTRIPAPSAVDAQDSFVPVTMHVAGDELILDIAHRSRDVAYPILVDPRVITYAVGGGTPGWQLSSCDPCGGGGGGGPTIQGLGGGSLTSPAGADYGHGEIDEFTPAEEACKPEYFPGLVYCFSVFSEAEYTPRARWSWSWPGHPKRLRHIREVAYTGVSITPGVGATEENGGYTAGTGWWNYSVGCYGSSNFGEAPPATVTGCGEAPNTSLSLNRAPSEFVWWGPFPPSSGAGRFSTRIAPTSEATTLSIEAAVVTEEVGLHRRHGRTKSEHYGNENHDPCAFDPVNCVTGNLSETQTDLHVPGRGVGLDLTRTYNSQAAAGGEGPGPFGYGWSWSFGAQLTDYGIEGGNRLVVEQGDGGTVAFTTVSGQTTTAPGVQAKLRYEAARGQTVFTLPNQVSLRFNGNGGSGDLVSETDRNGNVTSVARSCSSGCRIEVTDPAGRKLTLYENSEGLVERATDPMGNTVTYGYEQGNLVSVTEPGESAPRWRFHYDSLHRMTAMIDGRGATTTNEYDSESRVTRQTDRRGDVHTLQYAETGGEELEGALGVAAETPEEEHFLPELDEEEEEVLLGGVAIGVQPPYVPPEYTTRLTDESNGAVTLEHFDAEDRLNTVTNGLGTPSATTRTLTYDSQGNVASETNGLGHTTHFSYDAEGNKTSETDPLGDKAEWKYDSEHDVVSQTTPRGETTTITRDEHGNATEVSRPAPHGETQSTKYAYGSFGELTGMTDPLSRTWQYEYDGNGDRIAELSPQGDKSTFAYNGDSQETSKTSPRGNVPGADALRFTTVIERDAQGRVVRVIEPVE